MADLNTLRAQVYGTENDVSVPLEVKVTFLREYVSALEHEVDTLRDQLKAQIEGRPAAPGTEVK